MKPICDDDEDDAVLTNPWLDLCATLTTRKQIEDAPKRIIKDPDDPAWWGCFIWMAEVAFGKPRSRSAE